MIAVGGDSGTGKSTLCRGLDRIFGADRISNVCLDDYHALDRAQRKAVKKICGRSATAGRSTSPSTIIPTARSARRNGSRRRTS
jgi:ABC-type phosphate/phosphonate transport system ATPase subunit